MELQQIRSEIERKISEKDEEIDNLRYQSTDSLRSQSEASTINAFE